METLLIVQSIALLLLTVSNVITVKTLKRLSENIASYKAVSDNQFRIVSRGIYKLNEKVEPIQNLVSTKELTGEELTTALKVALEESKANNYVFGGQSASTGDQLQRIAALNDPTRQRQPADAKFVTEGFVTPQKYILGATGVTPAEVEKMSKAEAEQVLRDYAEEKKIEAAEKILQEKTDKERGTKVEVRYAAQGGWTRTVEAPLKDDDANVEAAEKKAKKAKPLPRPFDEDQK